jgi:4'-phosphopantetheinyl transferase
VTDLEVERPYLLASALPDIDVWWCNLDQPSHTERFCHLLSADEAARADRFGRMILRNRYVAGRAFLRLLLGEVLGVSPRAVSLQRGKRGRPELPRGANCDFNVSHTNGVGVIGIARNTARHLRIGVDVERRDREVDAERLSLKFSGRSELESQAALPASDRREHFLRFWTYKEAMSKATGDGLIAPFGRIELAAGDPPRLVSGPPPYVPEHWRLRELSVPLAYFAALAIWKC